MFVGIGVGIGRNRFAQGIFNAYNLRVVADGGITEAGNCVNAVSSLLQSASLLLIPSGYKGGKLYAEIPTNGNGDLTWTRGSDAFRTNASGVLQRVPWNLASYSEAFDNAYWTKSGCTISANSTTAPNGTTTADKLVSTNLATSSTINVSINIVSGTSYNYSIYAKASGANWIQLIATGVTVNSPARLWVNLSDGSLGTNNGGFLGASITNVGDGWYRINGYFTTTSTSTNLFFALANGDNINAYTGDGTSGAYIWGAQLVEGTTAQTYLPTTDRLNFPRLSYMYGSCPALLLEPQRTNLALWSEDFSNAIYTKTSVTVTSNSTTAPDGNTTADTLSKSAGVDATCTQEIIATSTGYAGTVFIKQDNDETRFPEFFLRSSSSSGQNEIYVQLNTKTGAIATRLTTGTTSASTPVLIGGYWRMSLYVLANSNTVRVGLRPAAGTTLGVFNANASGSIIAWGLQVEPNAAYPTTIIPTTSATATRVADSFSRSNIYTNGLISASGGTWFVELRNNVAYTRDSSLVGLFLGDTSVGQTNSFAISCPTGNDRLRIGKFFGGYSQLFQTTTDTVKIAIKWNGSTADIFVNGTKQVSATAFTATALEFLAHSTSGDVPKFIQQMALFPTPLSDTDCATLTT